MRRIVRIFPAGLGAGVLIFLLLLGAAIYFAADAPALAAVVGVLALAGMWLFWYAWQSYRW